MANAIRGSGRSGVAVSSSPADSGNLNRKALAAERPNTLYSKFRRARPDSGRSSPFRLSTMVTAQIQPRGCAGQPCRIKADAMTDYLPLYGGVSLALHDALPGRLWTPSYARSASYYG